LPDLYTCEPTADDHHTVARSRTLLRSVRIRAQRQIEKRRKSDARPASDDDGHKPGVAGESRGHACGRGNHRNPERVDPTPLLGLITHAATGSSTGSSISSAATKSRSRMRMND